MKRTAFAALCSIAALFAASCGRTISDSQAFKPNRPPVLSDITWTLPAGASAAALTNNMLIKITVTASDPEGKELTYSLTSGAGSVSNVVPTATGCTAELYTTKINPGGKALLSAAVKDVKGASVVWKDQEIGSARTNAKITLAVKDDGKSSDFIKPSAETTLTFESDSDGYYQVFCGTGEPLINEDEPGFMYTASGNPSEPNRKDIKVEGNLSTANGKIRIGAAADGAYTIGVAFRDNIRQYSYAYYVVNQDGTPPAIEGITPNGGARRQRTSDVAVTLNEALSAATADIEVMNDFGDAKAEFYDAALTAAGVKLSPKDALTGYATYTVTVKAGSTFTDIAGNVLTLPSNFTGTFSTQGIGKLGAPKFTYIDETNSTVELVEGHVFPFTNGGQSLTVSSEADTSVCWQTGTSAPSAVYTNGSSAPLSITKNTTWTARAFRRGFEPSDEVQMTAKMKTRTPELTIVNGSPLARSFIADTTILYPTNGGAYSQNGTITFSGTAAAGAVCRYSTSTAKDSEPPASGDPDTNSTNSEPALSGDGQRIRVKMIATQDGMEPSDVVTSTVYHLRELTRSSSEATLPASQYPLTENVPVLYRAKWVAISSSYSGQHLAAIENGSYNGTKGYIWTSDDYGVTWSKGSGQTPCTWTGVSIVCNEDPQKDGAVIAASENTSAGTNAGRIWVSSDYGNTFSSRAGSYNWTAIAVKPGAQIIALETSSQGTSGGREWFSSAPWNTWAYPETNCLSTSWNRIAVTQYKSIDGGIPSGSTRTYVRVNSSNATTISFESLDAVAYSYDSSTFAATGYNSITATNRSGSFQPYGSMGYWIGLTLTRTGNYLFAATTPGHIFRTYSSSYGTSYGTQTDIITLSDENCCSIAANFDASSLAAASARLIHICPSASTIEPNTGTDYTQTTLRSWAGVACSGDGSIIMAVDNGIRGMTNQAHNMGGYIYVSTDGGVTWSAKKRSTSSATLLAKWTGVAVSSDGTFAAAIAGRKMYYSTDSGATWKDSGCSPATDFKAVSVSGVSDGNAIAAAVTEVYIYALKTDGTRPINGGSIGYTANDVSVSHDGGTIIVSRQAGTWPLIRYRKDAGFAMEQLPGTGGWSAGAIAASGSGSVIYYVSGSSIAAVSNGGQKLLTGFTFSNDIRKIRTSYDGTHIWVLDGTKGVVNSPDGGTTWTKQSEIPSGYYNCLAATADGLTIFAGAAGAQNITVLK